jgi:flagellar biosynthesis/type III secretory pathway protein FliH
MEITILYNHWQNLEPEERTANEFELIVRSCERVLWSQNREYIRAMQEALQEADLEKEASLINQLVKESAESAERAKETMRQNILETSQEFLADTEQRFDETAKTVLGSLAEEASSEIVQKELEAMGQAITDAAENVMQRVSGFAAALAQSAQDYAHVNIGKDTDKEELNTILASLPKTNDVKG